MQCASPESRRLDVAWCVGAAIPSSIWNVSAASRLSPTYDEPIYLHRGLAHWRTKDVSVVTGMGTMPLPIDVHTAPLYFWERWRGAEFDPKHHEHQLVPWMRPANLLFWWI